MLATQSVVDAGFDSNWYISYSSSNAVIRMSYLQNNLASGSPAWTFGSNNERWVDGRTLVMASQATPNRIYKISMANGSVSEITTGMTDNEVNTNYNKSFWYGYSVPSSSVIASRNYVVAPSLKVRVTGILSDQ